MDKRMLKLGRRSGLTNIDTEIVFMLISGVKLVDIINNLNLITIKTKVSG